jgi:hypothetical protein
MYFFKDDDVRKLLGDIKDGKISVNEAEVCLGRSSMPCGVPVYLGVDVATTVGPGCLVIMPNTYAKTNLNM